MYGYVITAIVTSCGALIAVGTSYGVMRARLNNHSKELTKLDDCKAEKDVMRAEFKSLTAKLDLLIELTKNVREK